MKFEEGALIASLIMYLEMDFHLRVTKNLIFINMLCGLKVGLLHRINLWCHILIIWSSPNSMDLLSFF